jgi:hypothetical protein
MAQKRLLTSKQKIKAARDLGIFLFEKGELLTETEYKNIGRAPVPYRRLKSFFGSWPKVLNSVRLYAPDVWEEINAPKAQQKQQKVEKPVKEVAKPDAKEALSKTLERATVVKETTHAEQSI